jgi:hypothetical protein
LASIGLPSISLSKKVPSLSIAELLATVDGSGAVDGAFDVRNISGTSHYIGRDGQGHPALLIGSERGAFHAPVRLALIEARFGAECEIKNAEGDRRREYLTTIICTTPDAQAQAYFLHVCETIVRILGPSPTLPSAIEVVERLIDLFRHLAKPPARSLTGLIGELCLIAWSRDTVSAASAWRSSDLDRFDLSAANVRLDVKATSDRIRAHHLSAEQCQPPPGTVGLLASIFVEASGGGLAMQELIQSIEGRLHGHQNLVLKVQQNVAKTLGDALPSALSARFDDRLARASLQFYDMASIPAVRGQLPSEVSHVHFRSDLSNVPPLDGTGVAALSHIAAEWLPA